MLQEVRHETHREHDGKDLLSSVQSRNHNYDDDDDDDDVLFFVKSQLSLTSSGVSQMGGPNSVTAEA